MTDLEKLKGVLDKLGVYYEIEEHPEKNRDKLLKPPEPAHLTLDVGGVESGTSFIFTPEGKFETSYGYP